MRLLIIGAGGLAREVIDLAEELGHEPVACYQAPGTAPALGHVVSTHPIVSSLHEVDVDAAVLAVGAPLGRERLAAELLGILPLVSLVHPSAYISRHAVVGTGCLVMQNAVITSNATVGEATLVNVGAYVAHDCTVGRCCHIAPGTQLGGGSFVGDVSETGLGAVVLPGRHVGAHARVGAGAVVVDMVADGATVAGVPARLL